MSSLGLPFNYSQRDVHGGQSQWGFVALLELTEERLKIRHQSLNVCSSCNSAQFICSLGAGVYIFTFAQNSDTSHSHLAGQYK